jgi:hypothetical protein
MPRGWSTPRSTPGSPCSIPPTSMAFDGAGGFGDAEALLGEVLAAEPALRARIVLGEQGRDHAAAAL